MPWTQTPARVGKIANSVLAETGDEGRAIREANAMVAKDFAKHD